MKKNLIEAEGLRFYVGDMVKIDPLGTDENEYKGFWKLAFKRRRSDRKKVFKIVRIRYKVPTNRFSDGISCKVEYDGQISTWISLGWFEKI